MNIEIEFTLTKKEISKAIVSASLRTPLIAIILAALLVAMLTTLAMGLYPIAVIPAFWLLGLSACIFFGAVCAPYMVPELLEPQSMTLTDARFEQTCAVGNSSIAWSWFRRSIETRHFFLFKLPYQAYGIVPKRAMTPEQIATLSKFVDNGCKSN